ncbi:MAG: DNA/RNA helicase domain-containing protein [Maribacter arcticus]|uniref:DNA/RNA helicase domain-containing protein n=1 Tax=Maribacter arcticus TaxID=561365 RepID=UPI00300179C8
MFKKEPIKPLEKADNIIKNTYRTLLTSGMKGCYVYFCDEETKEFFKDSLILN